MAVDPVLSGDVVTETPKVGQELEINLFENVPKPEMVLWYGVSDSQGNDWARKSLTSEGAVYATTPTMPGELIITCTLMRQWDSKSAPPLKLHATIEKVVEPSGDLLPGQQRGKIIVGMSTDDYQSRVRETGPIGADHFFMGSWDPQGFLKRCKESDARGLFPYGNMKTGDWGSFGSSSGDAKVEELGRLLADWGKPCRVTFHHEPGFKSPDGDGEGGTAREWVDMAIRQYPRLKNLAPQAITGPVINGFILDPRTAGSGWTDAELDKLFTDQFFESIDAFGGDYYDGATSPTNGQPVSFKLERANSWLTRRWPHGRADIGETSFIKPEDMGALWNVVSAWPERWWCILAFNSDSNNRPGIPTQGGGWNFTHDYRSTDDRLNAFKKVLADPISFP